MNLYRLSPAAELDLDEFGATPPVIGPPHKPNNRYPSCLVFYVNADDGGVNVMRILHEKSDTDRQFDIPP